MTIELAPRSSVVVPLTVPATERVRISYSVAHDRASYPDILRAMQDLAKGQEKKQDKSDFLFAMTVWLHGFATLQDPTGGDLLACPLWTLDAHAGDCLTLSTLACCLSVAAGLSSRLVLLKRECEPIDHVICETFVGEWLAIDPVSESLPGKHAQGAPCFRTDTRVTFG